MKPPIPTEPPCRASPANFSDISVLASLSSCRTNVFASSLNSRTSPRTDIRVDCPLLWLCRIRAAGEQGDCCEMVDALDFISVEVAINPKVFVAAPATLCHVCVQLKRRLQKRLFNEA